MRDSVGWICILTLVFLPLAGHAEVRDTPYDRFFCGVEVRIDEADAIVSGKAYITEKVEAEAVTQKEVRAEIRVHTVLKGDTSLQTIKYVTAHAPQGFTTTRSQRYWSPEDEEHYRLIESFPYSLNPNAVFFLKTTGGVWQPFYVYMDDESHTLSTAISQVIETEVLLRTHDPVAVLQPLVAADKPHLVREYAVRSIMNHNAPWSIRTNLLMSAATNFPGDSPLYSYMVGSVVAHLRHEATAVDAKRGLEFLAVLVDAAPDTSALDSAVSQLQRVVPLLKINTAEAKALSDALIRKRGLLSRKRASPDVLTEKDKALIKDFSTAVDR